MTESAAQAQQEQKIETRTAGERIAGERLTRFTFIAAALAALRGCWDLP
jgi:hypothetical protein